MDHARSFTTTALRGRRVARLLVVAVFLAAVLGVPWDSTFAQDSGADQAAATPVAESVIPADQSAATAADPSASASGGDPSPSPSDDATSADGAASTPTPTEVPATSTVVPSPKLAYAPNAKPTCRLVDGEPRSVAAGGSVDYRCDYGMQLSGANLASSWISLDWVASVSASAGWTVQLAPDAKGVPVWSAANAAAARLEVHGGVAHASDVVVDAFSGAGDVSFLLRLTRPACGSDAPVVSLVLSAVASLPGHDGAAVSQGADQPAPYALTPKLAALVETAPTVTIAAFTVAPAAFSLTDQTTVATLTIVVDNPVHQCRDWSVIVDVRSFLGDEIDGTVALRSIGPLQGAPDSGYLATFPQDRSPYVVATIANGADFGQFTQTIEFALTIPGKTASGAYQSSASARVLPKP
jgi:hypothetical protein